MWYFLYMNKNYKHDGRVIAGRYEGKGIFMDSDNIVKIVLESSTFTIKRVHSIRKEYITRYEVLSQESQVSSSSAYKKSLVGGFFFGGAGAVAGAASANRETTYRLAIYYPEGDKSLIEVDSAMFAAIQRDMF